VASLSLTDHKLNGLVLVGGKSSRMGSNKAFLEYNGTPQINNITTLLHKFCTDVYVSAKNKTDYQGYQVIEDKFPFESPLNGIISAFQHTPNSAWLVVACDMPFINTQNIKHLVDHRDPKKLATCYKNKSGKAEPLFCIWEAHSHHELKSFHLTGNFSPRSFLMTNEVRMISSKNESSLLNVNTVEEYNKVTKDNQG